MDTLSDLCPIIINRSPPGIWYIFSFKQATATTCGTTGEAGWSSESPALLWLLWSGGSSNSVWSSSVSPFPCKFILSYSIVYLPFTLSFQEPLVLLNWQPKHSSSILIKWCTTWWVISFAFSLHYPLILTVNTSNMPSTDIKYFISLIDFSAHFSYPWVSAWPAVLSLVKASEPENQRYHQLLFLQA